MILVAIGANLKLSEIPFLSSNILQNFKQIEQKTSEILRFNFFIALTDCICDVSVPVKMRLHENLENGDVHFDQMSDFGIGYIENN